MRESGSDALGRYYTKHDVGNLLVSHINKASPKGLLDLGSGGGTLAGAAARRWAKTSIITVDVDTAAAANINAIMKISGSVRHHHICADVFSLNLPELIKVSSCEIDTAVCNPPFIKPEWRKVFGEILEDVGFSNSIPMTGDVDAALLFLAQNLRIVNANATLGIILPDTIISTVRYRRFRQELLDRYKVEKIIKLPRGSFIGTDALASIAIVQKGKPTTEKVSLCKLTSDRLLSSTIEVTVDEAIERFDYDYHHTLRHKRKTSKKLATKLADLVIDVKRGSIQNAFAKSRGIPVLHTSDMSASMLGSWCTVPNLKADYSKSSLIIYAEKGDILLARVGRNIECKTFGVLEGSIALTDCVYRIRLPQCCQDKVLAQLSSSHGQTWLASRAYGVAAKQLTKVDLLNFPVVI